MTKSIVGLKELRNNMETYITAVENGESFTVVRRSKPILQISSPNETSELWENVIDFTKIKKGGALLTDLLSRL